MKLSRLSKILIAALLFAPCLSLSFAPALNAQQAMVEDGRASAHVVRLSVNKTAVVRLPAIAKDVLIGNPGIADAVVRNANTAYLFARAPGQTNIFFFDAAGRQISSLDIEVTRDPTALQRLLDKSLPDSSIKVDAVGDSLILSGIAQNGESAARAMELAAKVTGDAKLVVSSMTIAGKDQVMLKVRIAEMQRSLLQQLGIDSPLSDGLTTLPINFQTLNTFGNNAATSVFLGANAAGRKGASFDTTLKALETQGYLRTLAEPTLTAITGESANFLAGGQYPIPTTDANGNPNTAFKDYGVKLSFTPTVLSEGRISLKIATEVSDITTSVTVNGVPGVKTRSAQTAVEMPSGGSMVMAGLIQDSQRHDQKGMSGLKDIPILGQLFRSAEYNLNQTELVVIITPYVVEPVSGKELSTPIDAVVPASTAEQIFFGSLNKTYGLWGSPEAQSRWRGQIGYIVE